MKKTKELLEIFTELIQPPKYDNFQRRHGILLHESGELVLILSIGKYWQQVILTEADMEADMKELVKEIVDCVLVKGNPETIAVATEYFNTEKYKEKYPDIDIRRLKKGEE